MVGFGNPNFDNAAKPEQASTTMYYTIFVYHVVILYWRRLPSTITVVTVITVTVNVTYTIIATIQYDYYYFTVSINCYCYYVY